MSDDIDLVKNFVNDSDFPNHVKDALLQCLMLEKLNKPETDFDRFVKELAKQATNED